jgi:hypothetical protein
MERAQFVTVYQGSDRESPHARSGSLVTTSREEAVAQALALEVSADGGVSPDAPETRWLLEMHVRRDQIDWQPRPIGGGEPEQGTLLVKSVVVDAESIDQAGESLA